jgi:hypothetical protein
MLVRHERTEGRAAEAILIRQPARPAVAGRVRRRPANAQVSELDGAELVKDVSGSCYSGGRLALVIHAAGIVRVVVGQFAVARRAASHQILLRIGSDLEQ